MMSGVFYNSLCSVLFFNKKQVVTPYGATARFLDFISLFVKLVPHVAPFAVFLQISLVNSINPIAVLLSIFPYPVFCDIILLCNKK